MLDSQLLYIQLLKILLRVGQTKMQILAVKCANPNNEYMGYLRAILFRDNNNTDWEPASSENVPEGGETLVHTGYSRIVEAKFKINELILANIEELRDPGRCFYGSEADSTSHITHEDDLVAVFNYEDPFKNLDFYNITVKIRPPLFSFLKTIIEEVEVLVGPMILKSSTYNETDSLWDCRLGFVGENSRIFSDLNAYSAYVIPVSSLPKNTIQESLLSFNSDIMIGVGLKAFIKTAPISQENFISDSSLIKIMDEALNPNSKLGRKGKRDLISQIEAAKKLSPTMKAAITGLLERIDELDDENSKILKDAVSQYLPKRAKDFPPKDGEVDDDDTNTEELQSVNSKLKERVTELETQNKAIKSDLNAVSGEYEKAKSQATNDDDILKTLLLEEELAVLKEAQFASKEVSELAVEKNNIQLQIEGFIETREGLRDTISNLESSLALNTNLFRQKALEVLPFLEIMNNVKPLKNTQELDLIKIDRDTMFVPQDLPDLVQKLFSRVERQGFQADKDWLKLVTALYLSSKFIGYFGDPGTGKTTLATCFRNAFGESDSSNELIKVGRGWSSFVDFIGYDNSFTGEFKYKNKHFKRFESQEVVNNVFQSLVFDEATLSAPEFYLSDFSTFTDLNYSSQLEEKNLDGHSLYMPTDMRIILTFNVDDTTEELSDRFVSRTPIIYLTTSSEFIVNDKLNFQNFRPIDKGKVDELVLKAINTTENSEAAIYEYDRRLPSWKGLFKAKLSARKITQIERFLNIAGTIEEIDPSVVVDFVEEVFLLPLVKGDTQEFKDILDRAIPNIKSVKAQKQLARIKSQGQKYNIYRHI